MKIETRPFWNVKSRFGPSAHWVIICGSLGRNSMGW
jgi:hypothetical protein